MRKPRIRTSFRPAHGGRRMTARGRALVVTIGIFFLLLGSAPLHSQNTADSQFFVFGELRADDWTPIAGTVELVPAMTNHGAADHFERKAQGRASRAVARTTSDVEGAFELIAPRAGLYWIQASAPGYATVQRNLQFLGTSRKLQPLPLPAAMVRTFRVESPDGDAIEGAMVRVALNRERGKPSDSVISAVGLTTAQGRVELEIAVGNRTAQIDVVADGYVPGANRNISAEALRDDWSTITLLPGQARTLSVNADAKPVEGAIILLQGGRLPVARTGEQGTATVWVPPNATAASPMPMVAEADGLHFHFGVAHRDDATETTRGPAAEVIAVPARTEVARGVVVDQDDEPVAGAWVWLAAPFSDPVRTDNLGRFALRVGVQYPTDDHKTQVGAAVPGVEPIFVDLGQHDRIVLTPPPGGMQIRVTDVDGKPIEGARITATPNITQFDQVQRLGRQTHPIAMTGPSGAAQLALPLEDLAYALVADKQGFQRWEEDLPPASDDRDGPRTLEIELTRGTVQVGWVVDEDDIGIEGASVEVHRNKTQSTLRQQLRFASDPDGTRIARTTTGEGGRFEIRDLPPQRVRLEADAPGFAPTEVEGVDLLETDGELGTIVLGEGHELAGQVVDDDGQPVRGVPIHIRRQANRMVSWTSAGAYQAESDENGHFSIPDLRAANYVLSVNHEGYRDINETIEVPTDEPVVLRLIRGFTLPVRITGANGDAPERVYLNWRFKNPEFRDGQFHVTSGNATAIDGEAEFVGLEPGTFLVDVNSQRHKAFFFDLVIDERGRASTDHEQVRTDGRSLDIQLIRGVALRGTVRGPDGEEVTRLEILRGSGSSSSNLGTYEIFGLEPGILQITFRSPGYAAHEAKIEIGTQDVTYDVTLEEGWAFQGTVTERESGTPIPAATLQLQLAQDPSWTGRVGTTTVSDEAGRFTFEGIGPGQYRVSASADGYASQSTPLLNVDGPPSPLSFELSPGTRLFGLVTRADEPVEQARVSVNFLSGEMYTTQSGFDGRYELVNLPAGVARLGATVGSGLGRSDTIDVPRAGELEHDVELGTNRLTGTVTRAGAPFVDAVVVALSASNVFGGPQATTDANGAFELEGMPEGTYEVVVMGNQGALALTRQRVDVFGDAHIDLEVDLVRLAGQVLSNDGEPVSGANVMAKSNAADLLSLRGSSATTDLYGRFALDLPADAERFELTASATGYGPARASWARGQGSEIELRLAASGGTLQIRWGNAPPETAQLHLTDSAGAVVAAGFGSRYQGWRMEDVPAGQWTLWITSGLAHASVPVQVEASDDSTAQGAGNIVEVTWPATGLLRMKSTSHDMGVGGVGAIHRFLDANGVPVATPIFQDAQSMFTTLAQMSFGETIPAPVGTWILERIENGAPASRTTFTVEPGRVTETAFD